MRAKKVGMPTDHDVLDFVGMITWNVGNIPANMLPKTNRTAQKVRAAFGRWACLRSEAPHKYASPIGRAENTTYSN